MTDGAKRRRPGGRTARVRAAVVDAALAELVETGYAGLRFESVAERAGVHKTTLYRNWANKGDLVRAAIVHWETKRFPAPDTGSWSSDLVALAKELCAYLNDPTSQALLRTVAAERANDPELAASLVEVWSSRSGDHHQPIIRAIERGEIAGIEPGAVLELLMGPMILRVLVAGIPLDDAYAEHIAALVDRAVRGPDAELAHLDLLEAEAIHIFREVAAEFERPVLLFSGGKDSLVMLRLAEKAFWPCRLPFPVMHVDTGHNFPEVIEFRDRRVEELGARLVVASVQDDIDAGRSFEQTGPRASRNQLQTATLLRGIEEGRFDAAFGGARRDEEKARAKERVYSFRDDFGQWDPKNQRPELWSLYNGRHRPGEHIRVFPLSNWTELDIWQYIEAEGMELPSIYFAHQREVFRRDGMWLSTNPWLTLLEGETAEVRTVRYRTVGDATCTGAVESTAATLAEIVEEVAASRITERGATRADDRASEAAMEDRKREGYF